MSRILVADDNDDIRRMLRIQLEEAGHEVIEAEDGAIAIEQAQSELPDLILLDLSMPNVNGFEALTAIRTETATSSIPVIVVTARGSRDDLDTARSLGVSDFINKPWADGEVEMRIRWALDRHNR